MERGMSHCGQRIMAVGTDERHMCLETAQTPATNKAKKSCSVMPLAVPGLEGTGPVAHLAVECWVMTRHGSNSALVGPEGELGASFKKESVPFPCHLI